MAANAGLLHLLHHDRRDAKPRVSSVELIPFDRPRHLTRGWWHLPHDSAPAAMRKPVARAADRMRQIVGYLWNQPPPPPADAISAQDTRPGHDQITIHSGMQLKGSFHHLFSAGSPPPGRVRDQQAVTLISGSCPFSAQAARLVLKSGRRVPIADLRRQPLNEPAIDLEIDPALTLYEHDTSLRLASVGAGLAAGIPAEVEVTQLIDVPEVATMLHLLDDSQRGHIPVELLLRWCDADAVTDRCERLTRLMAQRWRSAYGATQAGRSIEVRFSNELEAVGTHLREALAHGRVPPAQELVTVAGKQNRLWRRLIEATRPATAAALADLSYAAAQLRAGLSTPDAPRLAVAVDNIQEFKIQRHAHQLGPLLADVAPAGTLSLVGSYPLGRTWVRDPTGAIRQNLYTHDPGHAALDAAGRRVELAQLAAGLYPEAAREPAVSR